MQPQIKTIREKKLIGKQLTMSFADYKVSGLWQSFMPMRKQITNHLNTDLISMAVYPPGYFAPFEPTRQFQKWAAVEVSTFANVPVGMETFTLLGGLYAMFHYKGPNTDNTIYRYIFNEWLPASGYDLDHRPHFEVLGNKYKNNDPESEEEICIPVKPRNTGR